MKNLSQTLTALNTDGASYRQLAERAEKLGYTVSHSTFSKYMTGKNKTAPAPETLEIFAAVFNTSLESLAQAAGLPEIHEPFTLPDAARFLSRAEREAVLGVVNTFISNRKEIMLAPREDQKSYRLAASSHDLSEDIPEKYGEE